MQLKGEHGTCVEVAAFADVSMWAMGRVRVDVGVHIGNYEDQGYYQTLGF
jgi:hypothetical protein